VAHVWDCFVSLVRSRLLCFVLFSIVYNTMGSVTREMRHLTRFQTSTKENEKRNVRYVKSEVIYGRKRIDGHVTSQGSVEIWSKMLQNACSRYLDPGGYVSD